ncbi:MAG: LamG-like jellyroll fold domain-containing protein [Sphingobacteriales bacterium]
MKKNKIYILTLTLISVGLSSCLKEFNPKSYAPPLSIDGFTSSGAIEKDALVGYYAFNGSLVDSVSGTAGINTGTTFAKGEVGQALQGAANAYVLAAPSDKVKSIQSFTISEWVNTPPPGPGIIGIFSLANTTQFWGNIDVFFENGSSNTNGMFRLHIDSAGNDFTYSVNNVLNLFGKWTNLTYTYDASATSNACSLYVNGSKVNSGEALNGSKPLRGNLSFPDIGNLVFGCVQFQTNPSQTTSTGSQSWAFYNVGQTDEVRVYNKVLTPAEISAVVALQGRGK